MGRSFCFMGLISVFGILGNAVGYWTGRKVDRDVSTGGIVFYLKETLSLPGKRIL